MKKVKVLNIEYADCTLEQAADDVMLLAEGRNAHYVVTPNAIIAETCFSEPSLLEAVRQANYCIPDGIGVVMASRIMGMPIKQKVAGYDLAHALLPKLAEKSMSLFILGAASGIAEKAAENIKASYPSIKIAGTHDGFFKSDDEAVSLINSAEPDVVFIALGSPKQELFMYKNRSNINAGVLLGLGGTVDGIAGVVKRAPDIFVRLNLEWLYRMICQPRRFVGIIKLGSYILRAVFTHLFRKT